MDVHRRCDYTQYLALKCHSFITYGKELKRWNILGGLAHKTDPFHTLVRLCFSAADLNSRQRGTEAGLVSAVRNRPFKDLPVSQQPLTELLSDLAFPAILCQLIDLYLLWHDLVCSVLHSSGPELYICHEFFQDFAARDHHHVTRWR